MNLPVASKLQSIVLNVFLAQELILNEALNKFGRPRQAMMAIHALCVFHIQIHLPSLMENTLPQ